MFVSKVTFAIMKTTPLMPLTGDPADQYSNVKPAASVEITFDENEVNPEHPNDIFEKRLELAFSVAEEACFNQLATFHSDFVSMIKD